MDAYYTTSSYQSVFFLVIEVLNDYARHERPSPTIQQLAARTGHSEEKILESLEFGSISPKSLLH
ncbi:hypothetical protein [Alkalicoccus saliphilus]|jgi:hypothetical protein|uniref:HTH iclR-type domain-containing protein n=1 Tax=Alkalicoccus saliphilus TaxID=200989 RepID=A0A2T4UAL5_9BACI|nr:hypothetical protein [Alkalicoccus saliphilus]PTL40445.1 hypothetical protein C6Y45_00610 [Alkalicoccus saliphilus]